MKTSDDHIVWRLREYAENEAIYPDLLRDAADYIEHQHASHDMMVEEIKRLTRERDVAVEFVDANKMALRNAVEIAKCLEAAERKVEKLREALREIEKFYGTEPWQLTKTMKETARAALAETESE